MDAPADVVYRCIADYRQHHRPGGFLPPAFTDYEIVNGGVGAGTSLRFAFTIGGRRRAMTATVTEPQPGRVLVERGSGVETTFTVQPAYGGSLVRFDTVIDDAGLAGLLNRLFAARLIRPIYEDELRRLDEYARALSDHGAAPQAAIPASMVRQPSSSAGSPNGR